MFSASLQYVPVLVAKRGWPVSRFLSIISLRMHFLSCLSLLMLLFPLTVLGSG